MGAVRGEGRSEGDKGRAERGSVGDYYCLGATFGGGEKGEKGGRNGSGNGNGNGNGKEREKNKNLLIRKSIEDRQHHLLPQYHHNKFSFH